MNGNAVLRILKYTVVSYFPVLIHCRFPDHPPDPMPMQKWKLHSYYRDSQNEYYKLGRSTEHDLELLEEKTKVGNGVYENELSYQITSHN